MPVSTSAKPSSSNHVLMALVISFLAIRNGFRSACPDADHHGDGWPIPAISNRPECATERRLASPSIRSGDRRILLTLFNFLGDGAASPEAPRAAGFRSVFSCRKTVVSQFEILRGEQ